MKVRSVLSSSKKKFLTYLWKKKSKSKFSHPNSIAEKLHIGAGYRSIEGWLNTDFNYTENSDVYFLDATKPFPFTNSQFEYVYSEHMIEHISRDGALSMLREIYRVLKPGGYLRLVTPDLNFVSSLLYTNSPDATWYAQEFYEKFKTFETRCHAESTINRIVYSWGHQHLYTFNSLSELLDIAGFKKTKKETVRNSEHDIFKNIEQHPQIVGLRFNTLESLCIEAQKI